MNVLALALTTALLSSVMTWCVAYLLYRARMHAQIRQLRLELAEELEERVRRGALAAGEELLPEFRREVTEGFREAMRGVARGDMAKEMARTGAEIVGGSLDTLFGAAKKRSTFRPW